MTQLLVVPAVVERIEVALARKQGRFVVATRQATRNMLDEGERIIAGQRVVSVNSLALVDVGAPVIVAHLDDEALLLARAIARESSPVAARIPAEALVCGALYVDSALLVVTAIEDIDLGGYRAALATARRSTKKELSRHRDELDNYRFN